ncbi:MAG: rod shape-determining protein MreC [Patescibacteria group bacterium]
MKSQFSNRARSRSLLVQALVVALLVSVAFFGFDTLTGGLVRSYARTTASLAWTASAGIISATDGNGFFATRRLLARENAALSERLALYEESMARFRALEDENEALRAIAQLAETEGDGLAARVLSSLGSSPYGTFVIGAGERDGVAEGSLVLTPGGFLLGTVSDADSHTASVRALFSPGSLVDLVAGNISFSAEGRGSGNARAEIPRDAKVAVGYVVSAPAYFGRPAGLIGTIESASSSATQTLFLRLPLNLDTLRFVYVTPIK